MVTVQAPTNKVQKAPKNSNIKYTVKIFLKKISPLTPHGNFLF